MRNKLPLAAIAELETASARKYPDGFSDAAFSGRKFILLFGYCRADAELE